MNIATARRNDPIQCFAAANKINKHLTKAQTDALYWITKHPGHTALELEEIAKVKSGRIHKRCGELAGGENPVIYRVYEKERDGWLLYPKEQNKIRYELSLFEPDKLKCDCGRIWTACGIATTGGYVTCPNCNATAYMPERKHYE
jgi:hypothetical protein